MNNIEARSIRVLLVDDHDIVRLGLRVVLEGAEDIVVVGEASNGDEALQKIEQADPDVVVMDLSMQGMDGVKIGRAHV